MESDVVCHKSNVKQLYLSKSRMHALFRQCFVTLRSDLLLSGDFPLNSRYNSNHENMPFKRLRSRAIY